MIDTNKKVVVDYHLGGGDELRSVCIRDLESWEIIEEIEFPYAGKVDQKIKEIGSFLDKHINGGTTSMYVCTFATSKVLKYFVKYNPVVQENFGEYTDLVYLSR